MQCYTELTPPTAVTHSLTLPFLSADSNNLVVAKTSLLQIFSFKTISFEIDGAAGDGGLSTRQNDLSDPRVNDDTGLESSFLGVDSALLRSERARKTKLCLVAEYTLSGTVTSLVKVKIASSKSGGEALLVGFRDAKLSLVEWDPERPGISTVSIHYYEQDELQGSPWTTSLSDCVNYLAVDPGSRCAALKFGARNLAILPFKQGDGDEDVAMDDWDEELDGPRPADKAVSKNANGDTSEAETPYGSSFVLRMSSLDPTIIFPIHLAFLHEYREPTFGILSSALLPSASLLQERKDTLTYMVFTLDLHQKASTTILSVTGLPYDLFKVIPLPPPVGGALLVGGNEIIHIDQAGKANGIGVNMFAKQCTSFNLVDLSHLQMRLEGCTIEQLSIENGEMLLILHNGSLAILSFRMDGRSVSGLNIREISNEAGVSLLTTGPSCASAVGPNTLFLGSENADSVVLGWNRRSNQLSRRKSKLDLPEGADEAFLDDVEDEDDDADDDLYGDGPTATPAATNNQTASDSANSKLGDYIFGIHDSLINIAPIIDMTLGKSGSYSSDEEKTNHQGVTSDLELVAATGRDKAGSLAVIHKNIQPKVIGRFEFPEARGIWTMNVKKPAPKGLQVDKEKSVTNGDYGTSAQEDSLMIVSKASADSAEISDVYALTAAGFEALTGTEFEPAAGLTVEAGTLGNDMRVIQVLNSEVRSYDGNLGLAQILPMFDDDTGAEPSIISASFADPFLLLLRDDASIYVARCDDNNELEEVEKEDQPLLSTKWLTGCLYSDSMGIFSLGEEPKDSSQNCLMFLLSDTGALHIYALPDLSKAVYVAEGLFFLPPVFSADYNARRSSARQTLTEIIVADLGDAVSKSPFLILRASNDDLTIYEPFRKDPITSATSLSSSLHFHKIHNPHLATSPEDPIYEAADEAPEAKNTPMRAISNLGGYSTVFLPGGSPSFVIKSSKSIPSVIGLQGAGVRGLSSFHTAGCNRGFIYADVDGVARVSQFPSDTSFDLGVAAKRIKLDQAVHAVAYHPPMECYVVATSTETEFELPKDDDHHKDWQREDILFKPTVEQSFLKLISPINWSVIGTVVMDPCETVICVKTLNLEVSETTNERRQLITVGTAISKGEDLATKGRLYVYDIVAVVPEPGRPETNKGLKLVAKEEIPRGAITGVSEVGTQGFMLVAQGQKCMVRGLKEDGTLLPVAFMDMNCYVTSVKELGGTGFCVMTDAVKGVWFTGYTEEPYKMLLFGKSAKSIEVVTSEFLPDGKDLYIVVADSDCNLHILQYDPEHPKSLHGHLLLHRTTFSLGGHLPTTMTLLPRTKTSFGSLPASPSTPDNVTEAVPEHEILISDSTGAISLLTPLSEAQYRRMNTLSTHLTNTLFHACGLNPRAYRAGKEAPDGMVGGRTVVDGSMVLRWLELGTQRRSEVAGRVGMDAEEVRDDLMALSSGLGYL